MKEPLEQYWDIMLDRVKLDLQYAHKKIDEQKYRTKMDSLLDKIGNLIQTIGDADLSTSWAEYLVAFKNENHKEMLSLLTKMNSRVLVLG